MRVESICGLSLAAALLWGCHLFVPYEPEADSGSPADGAADRRRTDARAPHDQTRPTDRPKPGDLAKARDKAAKPGDKAANPKDKATNPKDKATNPKDKATTPKDKVANPNDLANPLDLAQPIKWTTTQLAGVGHLYDVWGASATNVYAVGSGGTVARYDGNALKVLKPTKLAGEDLSGIWGLGSASSGTLYVTSRSGAVFRYEAPSNAWSKVYTAAGALLAVRGSGTNVRVVGKSGKMHYLANNKWLTDPIQSSESLNSIWMLDFVKYFHMPSWRLWPLLLLLLPACEEQKTPAPRQRNR